MKQAEIAKGCLQRNFVETGFNIDEIQEVANQQVSIIAPSRALRAQQSASQ